MLITARHRAAYHVMTDLVIICNDLYESHTGIILFTAFELATKFVKLMSKFPEDSKLNIYTLISRLLLICARCHYIVKEFIKAQEVLCLLCKNPRQLTNIDVLELWAFCLMHTEKYALAKQKVKLAVKVARTEEQKSRFQKLEDHLEQKIQQRNKDNKHDENGDSGNKLTESSGYSYGGLIDLVESANIDFEAEVVDDMGKEWSDTQSIADSEYSVFTDHSNASSFDDTASSCSTRSGKNKVRRKTKTVRRNKANSTDGSCSSQKSGTLPLPSFAVNQSSKFDMIQKWRNDSRQAFKGQRIQKGQNRSRKDSNEERRFSEEENSSENMSDVSSMSICTTKSMAGLSADEFSGSEYDVSDSGSDWCGSASDFEKEDDNIEEKSPEEPTYFQRSLSYHSGQFRARNILEKEYFQKGLDLNEECIESVASHYFKGKKIRYRDIDNKNFDDQCRMLPKIYKRCTISIESAHQAVCIPVEPTDEIQEIQIIGRSKCGQTFTDDTVVVQIHSKQIGGKVHGEVVSFIQRHRYKDIAHPVFVCLLDLKEGHLMKPLCRTVPKLHILQDNVKRKFKHLLKSRVEIYKYDATKGTISFWRYHDVQKGEREQWLFIVALIKWKPNKIYPLAAVIDVIHCTQNPYDGIRIMSKEYQVPYFYEKSTVEGIKAAFNDAKVFNTKDYRDRTSDLRVFTIDPPGSKDLDDALSITLQEDGSYEVGVHITDVSTIVKKNDPVDREAQTRCVTFYPGKGFRPFAMLPEPLSESICSLLPNQKKPVISVYFKFDQKGNVSKSTPTIQKSIIKSCKQFTYQEVQNILDDKLEEQPINLYQEVKMLYKLSQSLKEDRLGHASFAWPVEIDVSEDENPMDTYQAHSLVEEFMILTNSSIAQLLRRQYPGSVPLLCQQPPAIEVFDNWYNVNKHYIHHILGLQSRETPRGTISVSGSPPEGRTRKLTPVQTWVLEEIKDLVPETEQNISRIKQLIQSDFLHPKQALAYHEWNLFQESSKYVCSTEILANQDKGIHFSLEKKSYVHFTSPLRRYSDLIVHRLVSAMLKKHVSPYEPQEISDLCSTINDATKRANQFKKSCKQFIFGRFFKKNPVLFNGFVKEISDNGIKVVIPGLQKLPISRKEIQFKLLDVACKPEQKGDVDMQSMTEYEKDMKMVVVKWEKRLYSYIHRSCRKPKTSRFESEKKYFSPYLRIYPHQNTTFIRYKDHWSTILKCILNEKIDDLREMLYRFKDDEQTKLNISHDRENISSFKRSVTDVSSEVKEGIIVEHRCKFQVPYHHGQIIQLQMSASLNRGFLTPSPQVLDVTENIKFCIDHFDNPIKSLLRYAKLHTKSRYSRLEDYVKTWIPIVEMEATLSAVHNEDTAVINDIPVEFRGQRGRFVLTKGFCDIRDMDVSSGHIEMLSTGINDGTEDIIEESDTYTEQRINSEEEDTPMSAVNVGQREDLSFDGNPDEIKTNTASELEVEESDKENKETENQSQNGSLQKKKPKYTNILSPHFLCIKLKRPLPENVKAKMGNCLPRQSQYIWVAHGELLKSRKIRTKKFSKRRECFKKVLEIDLVFKLHENSPSPPVTEVTSDDKCSIELILKPRVFRRIECYIKLLGQGQASELAENIALGHPISAPGTLVFKMFPSNYTIKFMCSLISYLFIEIDLANMANM
ncbi:3'-5' exoribonuclease HELZ2-like [Mytilus trossulus]|uniref:3'-5' exoribonuclease HELZ2-like n=1 Tax=Mytilus trossulus TaxID=6551 RepID=UPI0030057F82